MSRFQLVYLSALVFLVVNSIFCRDIILEFKGSYLLPTHSMFRDLYKGSALYGPELTVQLSDNKQWYGFASIDYFQQKGRCLSIASSTKLKILPLAIGIKYFVPISNRADLYFGLGFQSVFVRTKKRNACVVSKHSQWGFGGIGKVGAYVDLTHNFLLDLFVDYSFVRTNNIYGHTVTQCKSNLGAVIFGGALGYRFN